MRKRKKRNTVIHNCGNYRSLLNDGVQRGGALMDLICQLGHKNHGVELMDLSDMNRMNHVNHVKHVQVAKNQISQEQNALLVKKDLIGHLNQKVVNHVKEINIQMKQE